MEERLHGGSVGEKGAAEKGAPVVEGLDYGGEGGCGLVRGGVDRGNEKGD